jgi:hypothetical protein
VRCRLPDIREWLCGIRLSRRFRTGCGLSRLGHSLTSVPPCFQALTQQSPPPSAPRIPPDNAVRNGPPQPWSRPALLGAGLFPFWAGSSAENTWPAPWRVVCSAPASTNCRGRAVFRREVLVGLRGAVDERRQKPRLSIVCRFGACLPERYGGGFESVSLVNVCERLPRASRA